MVMNSYPPEPWDLHGHAYVGVWLVPRKQMPAPHSAATRPITIFGRGIVSAAYFVYEQPSPLTYDEIMSTVLVREGWRLRVSITHIWVNSPASRDGGRDLWAIPKHLAEFDISAHNSYVAKGIGSLRLGRIRRLPFALPIGFRAAQDRNGSLVVTRVRGRIRYGTGRASWALVSTGPLSFLSGRKPLLTLAVRPFHLLFGSNSP